MIVRVVELISLLLIKVEINYKCSDRIFIENIT